ncbi:hypothetical protein [Leptospira kmetyi]|uniref:hypothetical protein n=1 Tax=Leptospira kmetyi TaxID=408139 RepID=UPI00108349A9|nr:hypothetical protein [Leptospira kmetyi]TGK18184.1 hypothetical protein EHO62_06970 [Leptospira kmetyi]TGK26566.1 hypothetical protein EHO66_17540 [Leptospira kmetyi]
MRKKRFSILGKNDLCRRRSLERLAGLATGNFFRSSSGRIHTNAILVKYNGRIVLESYSSEFDENSLQPTGSIHKFFLNGALARAVAQELENFIFKKAGDENILPERF